MFSLDSPQLHLSPQPEEKKENLWTKFHFILKYNRDKLHSKIRVGLEVFMKNFKICVFVLISRIKDQLFKDPPSVVTSSLCFSSAAVAALGCSSETRRTPEVGPLEMKLMLLAGFGNLTPREEKTGVTTVHRCRHLQGC